MTICLNYRRPEGVMGGPCLNCGRSQPEHVSQQGVSPELLRARAVRLRRGVGNDRMAAEIEQAADEIEALQKWVDDLQSGMFVNCVYCGHRYGPGETTPVSMADALKAHVEVCPKHPMAKRTAALKELAEMIDAALRGGKGGDWPECARIVVEALK